MTNPIGDSQIIIYQKDDISSVILYAKDGNVWMRQEQIAELFDTTKQNISLHVINILKEGELSQESVIKNYLTTASDGKQYDVQFYSLAMIISIGMRIRGKKGTLFRQWANTHLQEYMIQGYTIDTDRLKNPDGRVDYFDELLAQIRDIRASEKRFYQKVRDLFALSSDYNPNEVATHTFFAQTQNKLLYAVTQQTAAELIMDRADVSKPNMALTSWKGSIVRKEDITIAKNYLTKDEIDTLNRLVVIFLESAELRVKNRQDITMKFWEEMVDTILTTNDKELLQGQGSLSHEDMKQYIESLYEQFDIQRKQQDALQSDQEDEEALPDDLIAFKGQR